MESVSHDPKTKQQIKDALYAYIYGPVEKHFRTRLETLIAQNTVLGGFTHRHFTYKGHLYNAESSPPPMKRNRLMAQLREPMDEYLRELDELNNRELPFVLGFINQVLNQSNSLADYFKVMPEPIHAPLLELQATCPCRMGVLSEEKAKQLRDKNAASISMIKQRLVTNLLI